MNLLYLYLLAINNGLIIQYGYTFRGPLSNGLSTNFPIAFIAGYKLIMSPASNGAFWQGNPPCLSANTSTPTAFRWGVYNGGHGIVAWIAISS